MFLLAACGPTPPDDPGGSSATSTGLEDPSTSTSLPTTSGDESTSSSTGSDASSEGSSSSESTGGTPNNFCTLCDIFGDCFPPNVCTLDPGSGLHLCVPPCERGDTCEDIEALCSENLDDVGFSCQQGEGGELLCLPARVS